MHPAALMLAGILIVAAVEIAHQMAREFATQDAFHHRLPTAVIIFIVAYRLLTGRTEGPNVAILAILTPAGLVGMQDRAGARLLLERVDLALQRPPYRMQQFNHFAGADGQLMNQPQIGLDAAHRQAQRQGQKRHQAGNARADPALPEDLSAQVKLRAAPGVAVSAPAFDDVMLDNLDRHGWRQLDHLATIVD